MRGGQLAYPLKCPWGVVVKFKRAEFFTGRPGKYDDVTLNNAIPGYCGKSARSTPPCFVYFRRNSNDLYDRTIRRETYLEEGVM